MLNISHILVVIFTLKVKKNAMCCGSPRSKTDIALHMPTVHPVLFQTALTVSLDARYAPIMHPYT